MLIDHWDLSFIIMAIKRQDAHTGCYYNNGYF
jgi:hypothetical protein